MEKNHNKIFEKMFGEKVTTEKIKVEGISETIKVDIYDGFAIGHTKKGEEVQMQYPRLSVIKTSPELFDELKDYLDDIENVDEISPVHVMQTFAKIYRNGEEIKRQTT